MSDRVSIITASFRSARTIRDTLESVNGQTYPHIEHLIIDGASDDDTLSIVAAHGKRVTHVTSEPDKGIYDAFNKGLSLATGDIVGILNSDDFYATPDVIARVVAAFSDPSVEVVYGDLVYVDKDDTRKIVRHWKSRPYRPGSFRNGFVPAHPTLFVRRSVYGRTGVFNLEYRLAADYEYMLRAFHVHGVKSVYLPGIMVRMRVGGATGGSLAFIKKQNQEILRALDDQGVKISRLGFFFRKAIDRVLQRLRAGFVRVPEFTS